MIERLTHWLRQDRNADEGQRHRSPWLRWLRTTAAIAVIGLSAYYLWRTVSVDIKQFDWRTLDLKPGFLLAAVGLTTFCVALGGMVWRLLLSALGYSLPLGTCMFVHTASNLAKYVPGYAWQLMGKAYLTHRERVPGTVIALALGIEFGGLLATAILVASLAMPAGAELPLIGVVPPWARIALAAILGLFLLLLPRLLTAWGRYASHRKLLGAGIQVRASSLWAAIAVMLLAWIPFGLGLGCTVQSLRPLKVDELLIVLYALTSSFVVSFLAIFVPGGIGVREGMMVYVLGPTMSGGLATVIAVLSRLILILSEVLAFGLTWGWRTLRHSDKRSITQRD